MERQLNEASRRMFGRALVGLPNLGTRRYLRRLRPGVVLAQFGTTGALLANDCDSVGVPLVVHFHGYDAYTRPILATYRTAYQRLFRSVHSIVVVSEHMRVQLERLGAPPARIACIPCGVDVAMFEGGNPAASAADFVAVGRMVSKKAPHLTLRAFARAVDVLPNARLTMIGDGPLRAESEALAGELGILRNVTFTGTLPHDRVAAVLRSARAFVHHAVTGPDGDSEGTPVSVLEAAATGLPIVSTNHGGIPDFVEHGRTGFVVEERDLVGMAEHIVRLGEDSALAASLGSAGRELVTERGSLRRSIGRLWTVLEEAMTVGSTHG